MEIITLLSIITAWLGMATGVIRNCYDGRNYKHTYKTVFLISGYSLSCINI